MIEAFARRSPAACAERVTATSALVIVLFGSNRHGSHDDSRAAQSRTYPVRKDANAVHERRTMRGATRSYAAGALPQARGSSVMEAIRSGKRSGLGRTANVRATRVSS